MKTYLKSIIPFFIVAVLFTSCSDDDTVIDTEKPQIAVVEPHNEDEFAPGSELHIEASFTDNAELASYKIEIHEDFDGHTHAFYKSSQDLNPWSWEETFNIPSGRMSFDAVHHIDIPTEIDNMPVSEGAYHVGIFVTDTSGNQQEFFLEIHIEGDAEGHTH
jgi:hypothetical protein